MNLSRESEEEEPDNRFLMTPTEPRVAVPHIPRLVTSQRSRRADKSAKPEFSTMYQRLSFNRPPQIRCSRIMFHECYNGSHYAPDCDVSLRHKGRMIQNYEQRAPAEIMSVSTTWYHRVRAILRAEYDEDKQYHSTIQILTLYSRGTKSRDPIYAHWAERHQRRLTVETVKRGDERIQAHLKTNEENELGERLPLIR